MTTCDNLRCNNVRPEIKKVLNGVKFVMHNIVHLIAVYPEPT